MTDTPASSPSAPLVPASETIVPEINANYWIALAALFVLVIASYWPSMRGEFLWDDDFYVTNNTALKRPDGIERIWLGVRDPRTYPVPQFYPMTHTSFWVQTRGHNWNQPLASWPFHLVNVLLHFGSAWMLWTILRRLGLPGAFVAAAIWALHPVQVESAAWVTEMKNTESCLFYLIAILLFVRWRQDGKEWRYAATLGCAALAILSKTSTVMLPVILGLCWWWMDGKWRRRNFLRLLPFALVSAAASGWTIWEQQFHSGAVGSDWALTAGERVVLAGKIVWFYLGKLVWPYPLVFIYPRWKIDASGVAAYLPAAAVGAAFLVLWWKRNGPLRPAFFAFAYFLVSLFPVLGFFNIYYFRYSFVGDHFQYLAAIGPLVLAGAGIATALDHARSPALKPAVCAVLLGILGTLSWRQARNYSDLDTLWLATLEKHPDSWSAHVNLGERLQQKGRTDEALAHYQTALHLAPNFEEIHYNLGTILEQRGRGKEAAAEYEKAIAINPAYAPALNNLGKMLLDEGRAEEAAPLFAKALAAQPGFAKAHNNLGDILLREGLVDEAVGHFQQALSIEPANAEAHNNLGNALVRKDRVDEGLAEYRRALELRPSFAEAHYNIGNLAMQAGRLDEAAIEFRAALAARPDFADASNNLGAALLQQGRLEEAVAPFEDALARRPDLPEPQAALTHIAWILATSPDPAARNGARALELATRMDRLAGGTNPIAAATLGAACAETGRFAEAIAAAERAEQLATRANNAALAAAIEAQIRSYRAGAPVRMPAR